MQSVRASVCVGLELNLQVKGCDVLYLHTEKRRKHSRTPTAMSIGGVTRTVFISLRLPKSAYVINRKVAFKALPIFSLKKCIHSSFMLFREPLKGNVGFPFISKSDSAFFSFFFHICLFFLSLISVYHSCRLLTRLWPHWPWVGVSVGLTGRSVRLLRPCPVSCSQSQSPSR